MKTRSIVLIYLALFSLAVAGIAVLTNPSSAQKKVNVTFKPRSMVYDAMLPSPYWNATIWRVDPGLINPSTVQLTGESGGRTIYPVAWEVSYPKRDDFIACFDPNDMKELLTDLLILHTVYGVPGKYRLNLKISGTYDGMPFEGIKALSVTVPNPPS